MSTKFTEKAENALNRAVKIAEDLGHTYVGSEHILLAVCEDDGCCAASIMGKKKITAEKLFESIKKTTGVGHKTKLTSKDTTPRSRRILESSYRIAKRYSSDKIGTEHILFAILDEGESVAEKILLSIDVDIQSLKDDTLVFLKTASIIAEMSNTDKDVSIQNLLKYGVDMTKCAQRDEYDPVIGRDKETERLIRILTRKNKNNPCLIGDAGVGKTAIVEGLAKRIASGNVPPQLKGKILISLDLASMVAGAKYRGDFEDRIKCILNEAKKNKSVILFIDEIHTIIGAGSAEGAIDAANIMKPQLSRGEIRIIGATTLSEYRKFIEKDSALERRFQPIMVEEPTESETLEILKGLKEKYEKFYGIRIKDSALEAAVKLSKRYIHERHFPDKAIDLVDEACAMVISELGNSAKYSLPELNSGQSERLFNNTSSGDSPVLYELKKQKRKLLSEQGTSVLFSGDEFISPRYDGGAAEFEKVSVEEKDIKNIIGELFGRAVDKEFSPGRLKSILKEKIVGQNRAIDELVGGVTRNLVGIGTEDRPKGVFLFIGETGVGKTELAKEFSYALYENENALITLDMSEFSEQSSVSKIIGSPPGYVGYDADNSMLERVRKHPYSVLLLDEIDKANPDVLALFLQVFDSGRITDSIGRTISFKNTYIIMTSNYGAKKTSNELGFLSTKDKELTAKSIEGMFTSEFISRLDAVIPFSSLDVAALSLLAERCLDQRKDRLSELGIDIEFQDGLAEYLAKITKKKQLGARPLGMLMKAVIDTGIAELIAEGACDIGDTISVTFDEKTDESGICASVLKERAQVALTP